MRVVIIAAAGRPVPPLDPVAAPEPGSPRRLGFLAGHAKIPDAFDRIGREEIAELFEGPA